MRPNIHVGPSLSSQRGVSLVDLVVVVTVAGILTAFAIPRMTHLDNKVRATEVVALGENLRNAAAAAHAQYVAAGSRGTSVTLRGRVVHLQNGYPDAGIDGIRRALGDSPEFVVRASATEVVFSKSAAPAAAQCAVTYHVASTSPGASNLTDVSTDGC